MEVEFNPIHFDESSSEEKSRERFKDLYEQYRELRKSLQNNPDDIDLQSQIDHTREELASFVVDIYNQSHNLAEFEDRLRNLLAYTGNIGISEVDQYILGAYIYPISLEQDRPHAPSPVEAIWTTLENLKIINQFVEIAKKYSDGIILSGSHAHSPFFAVRGKTPDELIHLGAEQRQYSEFSDIDFMVCCSDTGNMSKLISEMVASGLFDAEELQRFEIFQQLYEENKADIFSVRTHFGGVEESIHFVLNDTVQSITNFQEPKDEETGIGYVRDFRANMPKTADADGKYSFRDMLDQTTIYFDPKPNSMKYGDEEIGFVTRIPVGGAVELNKGGLRQTYVIGILSFFLQVCPAILHDREGILSARIEEMKIRIKNILGGKTPSYINRQNKMPSRILHKIKKSFSGGNETE